MSYFIPSFHFLAPEKKLTPEFGMAVVDWCYYNSNNRNLLAGKDVNQINDYCAGSWDMTPYKRMFKSLKNQLLTAKRDPGGALNNMQIIDNTGIDWEPVPLMPVKFNSAITTVQKIPIDIACTAQDALAMKKKKEDLTFLKNKPAIEADLQDLADQMQIGKVDIGTTKHSAKKFSDSPLGLDLTEPDEENIFSQLLYSLKVETAFEKGLQQFASLKKLSLIKLLEITDQLKFGVSCDRAFTSSMTGLPDAEYIFPSRVSTPMSDLPDFSDNTHRIIDHSCTVMELFNYFSEEICDLETLEQIINAKETGYCACQGKGSVDRKNWNTYKLNLKHIEVKSIDWVGVKTMKQRGKRNPVQMFTMDEKECTSKIWAQNTYGFFWLTGTKHIFGSYKLSYSHRTKGQESFQNFSTNIYKSQARSAAELSISENKKAQIADIKLQHALIKSLPGGKYVDLHFLRNALSGLKEENNEYTIQQLIDLTFEQNHVIGDTEGFDGKNDGQMKPVIPIPGGLNMAEIEGYITIMYNAARNISAFTGINEQLTGQSANPEGLVGLQKLLINSSINSIYYVNEAIRTQFECFFNNWASLLQGAIEKGGKTKEAMINFIGIDDVDLLDGLNDVPLHDLTIKVTIGQREVERQQFLDELNQLKLKGIITSADEYLISGIENPRERFAVLSVIEKKFMRKQDQIRAEQQQLAQTLAQQQGQNMVQAKQADGQEKTKQIYSKGEVDAHLMTLANQLGLTQQQSDALIKRVLQKDRGDQQLNKLLTGIRTKADVQAQSPIV